MGGINENLSSCARSLIFVLTDNDILSPNFLLAPLFRENKYMINIYTERLLTEHSVSLVRLCPISLRKHAHAIYSDFYRL